MFTLTPEQQGDLMQAVAAVLDPWMRDNPTQVTWRNEDGTTEPMHLAVRGVARDAPDEIKQLDAVYMAIISKGAFAVDHEEIERQTACAAEVVLSEPYDEQETPSATNYPLCHCGSVQGQHPCSTCCGRNLNA